MALKFKEEIPVGTKLRTLSGEEVVVKKTISTAGGQGDVMLASWNGKEYALKWYNKDEQDVVGGSQYTTISKLTRMHNPDEFLFLWPEQIVTETGSAASGAMFGYVMKVLPDNFYDMQDFLRSTGDQKQQIFKSFHAMIWAAMYIVTAVRKLHLNGMSYKDLNAGNISINPETGRILMVDCDNISVDGDPCSINGTRGYMAPEIVRSNFVKTPTIQSDQFSLAIILYRLFYMDHPMEGKMWAQYPLITEKVEDLLYSIKPVYNMSKNDERNRPEGEYAKNVIQRMKMLPPILREGFEKTFVKGIESVSGRTPENEWLDILSVARDQLVFLNSNYAEDRVVLFNDKRTIPEGCLRLYFPRRNHEVAIYPLQSLFKDVISGNKNDYAERIGFVNMAQGRPVLMNMSNQVWEVFDPVSKKITPYKTKEWFYVIPGMQILFDKENNIVGKIDDPCK